jgi:hypothetical protein
MDGFSNCNGTTVSPQMSGVKDFPKGFKEFEPECGKVVVW